MSGNGSDFFKTFGDLPIAGFCLSPEVKELLAPFFDKGARDAVSTDGCTNSVVFGPPRPPPPPFDYYFPDEVATKDAVKGEEKDADSTVGTPTKRKLSIAADGSEDGDAVEKKKRRGIEEDDAGSDEEAKLRCTANDGKE